MTSPAAALEPSALRTGTRIYANLSTPRGLVRSELDELLRRGGWGIGAAEYAVLRVLDRETTLAAAAEHLRIAPAAARRIVDHLAAEGLLASRDAPPGRSRRWLSTERGRALVTQVPGPAADGPFATALQSLEPGDRDVLVRQLGALLAGLQPLGSPQGRADEPATPAGLFDLWITVARLWRLVRAEQQRFLGESTDGALDSAGYMALYRIHEAPSSVDDVAAFLRVDRVTGLRVLERLEALELAETDIDEDAARTTAAGVRLLEAVPPLDPAGRFNRLVRRLPGGGLELDGVLERLVRGFGVVPPISLTGLDDLLDRIRARGEEQQPRSGVDRDRFRTTMSQFPTGVAVVTIGSGGECRGITVNSLTSVSLDPPMLLVCFDRRSRALERLRRSRAFAVNVLSVDQEQLAIRFGRRESDANPHALDEDMWSDVDGVPALVGALATIVCGVEDTFEAGSHTIVLASPRRIVADEPRGSGALGFWRSRYFPVREQETHR